VDRDERRDAVQPQRAAPGADAGRGGVGGGEVQCEVGGGRRQGRADVGGAVRAARGLGVAGRGGGVVPGALHGPDPVAVRTERLPGIGAGAGVDQQRMTVQRDDERTDVVMVVRFVVVAGFRGQEQARHVAFAFPGGEDAGVGQPGLERGGKRRGPRRGPLVVGDRGQHAAQGGVGPGDQAGGVLRPHRQGVLPHLGIAGPGGEAVQQVRDGARRAERAVREVDVHVAGDVRGHRVPGDGPDLGQLEGAEVAPAGFGQRLQALEQRGAGPPPVAGALVTAAVIGDDVEVAVEGGDRTVGGAVRLVVEQKARDEQVRVDPRGPVVQVLAVGKAEPPPVVAGQVRIEDAGRYLAADAVLVLAGEQGSPGEQRGGLGGEQVNLRPVRVGQAGTGLMRGQAPGGLLAQQPHAVRDVRGAGIAGEDRGDDGGGELVAAGQVRTLVPLAVAVGLEPGVGGGGQQRPRLLADGGRLGQEMLAGFPGHARPVPAVGSRRIRAPGSQVLREPSGGKAVR
jgi:hypothetical protein